MKEIDSFWGVGGGPEFEKAHLLEVTAPSPLQRAIERRLFRKKPNQVAALLAVVRKGELNHNGKGKVTEPPQNRATERWGPKSRNRSQQSMQPRRLLPKENR